MTIARHRIRQILLLAFCLSVTWANPAVSHDAHRRDLQVVATDDSDTARRIVQDLRKKFPSAQVLNDPTKRKPGGKDSVYITIGPSALRALLSQHPEGTIISTFTSSQAYRAILESTPEKRTAAITAIYAEPSPLVQLRLISMLYKRPVETGSILSAKTAFLESALQRAASYANISLTVETFSLGDNLNRVLNRLSDALVILALPDSTVYNAENIRNILVTTYRNNQAVVGFSAALVKAGALATTYSEIEDIDAQIDELVRDFEASGKLPEPQFPKYFRTIVNEDVARSLNIVVDESVKSFARKPAMMRQP